MGALVSVKEVYGWPAALVPTTVNSTPFAVSFYGRMCWRRPESEPVMRVAPK
jgi:hypothetical protein